ncbi:MAG: SLC13 family permease [Hyphomonadaceae bacterium]|nr:SLC13 family permease [Hyphomonadaceae bacterium]
MISDILAHWPMLATLIVVITSIGLYASDRWSMELVSIWIMAALLVLFALPGTLGVDGDSVRAADLLAGFGNPALITIMALLVVGQGLFQTGALESPTRALLAAYDKRPLSTLAGAFGVVFTISAFINNTPVVIMFLPVMSAIAQRMRASPAKLMMPLSFASVFAGMTTLIGTSTNLLAAETYFRITDTQLGFFDQTPVGLVLAGAGFVYLAVFSRWLLPSRSGMDEDIIPSTGKQFVAQIQVGKDHFLLGKRPIAGMFKELPNFTVRVIQRGERAILPPFEEVALEQGDLVIVAATRGALMEVLSSQPEMLEQIWRAGTGIDEDDDSPRSLVLTEAVVAPGSRMAGRTVEMLGFRRLTRAVVLGIQRRSHMIRSKLGEIRLEAGDTLLLCGPANALRDLRVSRDLILLEWSQTEITLTARALSARLITLGMVLIAASGLLSILHASIIAAVAMITFGCLNIRQASRALDLRIFLVIGAALAMGFALEATGADNAIAMGVVQLAEPYGTLAVLSTIFIAVAVMTNLLSNAATAVLFSPIALSAAEQIGAPDPLPFLLAVIYGANCSFATPIAYQTNLLVMGPGHYKFSDFLRFGGPLVLLLWAVFTLIAPWRFEL